MKVKFDGILARAILHMPHLIRLYVYHQTRVFDKRLRSKDDSRLERLPDLFEVVIVKCHILSDCHFPSSFCDDADFVHFLCHLVKLHQCFPCVLALTFI